jgi:hypothetical protein
MPHEPAHHAGPLGDIGLSLLWGLACYLPAHGAIRLLLDGAFTATVDEALALTLALAWMLAIAGVAGAQFHRLSRPSRT